MGGFYLGAYNRQKGAQAADKAKIPLTINLVVAVDNNIIFDQNDKVMMDENNRLVNERVEIKFVANALDTGLITVYCELAVKFAENYESIGTQQLNLEPGEAMTTLVAGDDRVKLTCQIDKASL